MSISIDTRAADEILRREWKNVLRSDTEDYLDDPELRSKIEEILTDDRHGVMTFKYMLLSNILAKAVNSDIHYRAIQTESDLDGAFSSRTIAEQVIVDWEQENGQRLGGSNEPGTSKPYRWAEVSPEIQVKRDDSRDNLYELLGELETRTETGEIDPIDVLRQALECVSRLEANTIDYSSPSVAPYRELSDRVKEYLEISGGGERLAAVAASVIKASYFHADGADWEVSAEHVNIPDQQSGAVGDIEIFHDGTLHHAYEVKDKPVEKNDIIHAEEKAQRNELDEYIYVVGAGFKDGEESRAVKAADDAAIELILVSAHELISRLKFVGREGRKKFIDFVGEFLNEMRATDANKDDWKEIAEGFTND